VVIFLYRDEYYKNAEGDSVSADTEQNIAEIIVAKNRHGSTESVKVGWTGRYTKFRDLVSEDNLPK
jgi:replicative DNA helicase